MVMGAYFCPAKAGKERFDAIGAAFAIAICLRVIDPLGGVAGVHGVPMRGFIGIDRAASLNPLIERLYVPIRRGPQI